MLNLVVCTVTARILKVKLIEQEV